MFVFLGAHQFCPDALVSTFQQKVEMVKPTGPRSMLLNTKIDQDRPGIGLHLRQDRQEDAPAREGEKHRRDAGGVHRQGVLRRQQEMGRRPHYNCHACGKLLPKMPIDDDFDHNGGLDQLFESLGYA